MSGKGTAARPQPALSPHFAQEQSGKPVNCSTPRQPPAMYPPSSSRQQCVVLTPRMGVSQRLQLALGLILLRTTAGILGLSVLVPTMALAHGVEASFRAIPTFQIEARYDTGEPMGSAQVTVFAPTDPTTPWQEGRTDAAGRFVLQPDPELSGLWQVRIRQAGHGVLLNMPVGGSASLAAGISSSSPSFGPLQRGVMAACVIWGCLATALFFSTPPRENQPTHSAFTTPSTTNHAHQ
jgi:nickel transport protein